MVRFQREGIDYQEAFTLGSDTKVEIEKVEKAEKVEIEKVEKAEKLRMLLAMDIKQGHESFGCHYSTLEWNVSNKDSMNQRFLFEMVGTLGRSKKSYASKLTPQRDIYHVKSSR